MDSKRVTVGKPWGGRAGRTSYVPRGPGAAGAGGRGGSHGTAAAWKTSPQSAGQPAASGVANLSHASHAAPARPSPPPHHASCTGRTRPPALLATYPQRTDRQKHHSRETYHVSEPRLRSPVQHFSPHGRGDMLPSPSCCVQLLSGAWHRC